MFGGFITVGIGVLTIIIMGLSVVVTLRLTWIWFIEGKIKKEDME